MHNDIPLPELVKVHIDNVSESSYIMTGKCYLLCSCVDMILSQFICLNQIMSDSECTDLNYPFQTRTIGKVLRGENTFPPSVWAAN